MTAAMDRTPRLTQSAYKRLASELILYSQKKFTGKLEIEDARGRQWSLYLSLGFWVWASGGSHPVRRWRRQLFRCNHKAYSAKLGIREADEFECWDYHALTLLAQRGILAEAQTISIIHGVVMEVLFDIAQAIANTAQSPEFFIQPRLGMRPSNTSTGILRRKWTLALEEVLDLSAIVWQQWKQYGMTLYWPNLAPIIAQPTQLQQSTSAQTYQKLVALIDGKRSLRDLAILTKQNLLGIARSLSPYIRKRLLSLVEVPDLPNPYLGVIKQTTGRSSSRRNIPQSGGLIACIDDSSQVCQTLEQLLVPAGYRFFAVRDAVQALPTLLQHKPDLIFLDLVMPIVNGYEICSQIRRISRFKDTPVIILTSQDGIIDRVRAKMVGTTDFMTKPIEPQKVLESIRKYHSQDVRE